MNKLIDNLFTPNGLSRYKMSLVITLAGVLLIVFKPFDYISCSNQLTTIFGDSLNDGSQSSLVSGTPESNFLIDTNSYNDCNGNRFEAIESGRQCLKRCRRGSVCENSRKQCLCDGLCGWSCVKPDLTCLEVQKLENGKLNTTGKTFHSKSISNCDDGYYLFGSKVRTCQGDEEWSGTPAECLSEPVCNNPKSISHAKNPSPGRYMFNETVTYQCYPGYIAHGSSAATCKFVAPNQTDWVWKDTPFRCIPRNCSDPGLVSNAARVSDSFTVGGTVTYVCNEGYEMIGQSKRFCQSDGLWSGQAPYCDIITCNPTDHLENGSIRYRNPVVFNSSVEYTCDSGFKLIGLRTRKCGPEKELLGEAPKCEEIDCGELGPLKNGYVRGQSSRMNDTKLFMCLEGMKFVGTSRQSTCLPNASWSHPLPRCLAPCRVPIVDYSKGIYLIDNNDNLTLNLTDINIKITNNIELNSLKPDTLVSPGTIIDVLCEDNYELEQQYDNVTNEAKILRCENGNMSFEPICKPSSCLSEPNIPKNARALIYSMQHGAIIQLKCRDGYKLLGKKPYATCKAGTWSNFEANCTEVYCPHPGFIENGRVSLVGAMGSFDYKTYVKVVQNKQVSYDCESGYTIKEGAPSAATCINGRWSPEGIPTCIKDA